MRNGFALIWLPIVICTLGFAQPVTVTFQQGTNGYGACRSANISSQYLTPIGQFGENGNTYGDGINDWLIGQLQGLPSFSYDISPLLKFDSLNIPPNARVVSASLTVRLIVFDAGARVIGRYLNKSWNYNFSDPSGGTLTAPVGWRWNNKDINAMWNTLGALGEGTDVIAGKQFTIPDSGTIPPTGEQALTISLDSAMVQQWIDTPSTNHGVKLQVDIPNIPVSYVQPQRATTPDKHPLLSITYEPPTTVKQLEEPTTFHVAQNYPNPFNPSTTIQFSLPVQAHVRVSIFDILGREMTTLLNEQLSAGQHSVTFDASGFAGGTYFYKIQAGSVVEVKKMVFAK